MQGTVQELRTSRNLPWRACCHWVWSIGWRKAGTETGPSLESPETVWTDRSAWKSVSAARSSAVTVDRVRRCLASGVYAASQSDSDQTAHTRGAFFCVMMILWWLLLTGLAWQAFSSVSKMCLSSLLEDFWISLMISKFNTSRFFSRNPVHLWETEGQMFRRKQVKCVGLNLITQNFWHTTKENTPSAWSPQPRVQQETSNQHGCSQ